MSGLSAGFRLLLLTLFSSVLSFAQAQEILSSLDDQQSVAVTIYNENLALIKDQRIVDLNVGINQLAYRDVSAMIRPETALLRSLDENLSLQLIEQNFDFDLLTPQKMLEKYVGKTVKIATMNPVTGIEKIEDATILSSNQGIVARIGNRIETNPTGRYIFDQVPANLRDKPTLVLQLSNKNPEPQEVELSYLSAGLAWKADYVAELNAADSHLDITGWVTLNNNSGTSYRNAKMQLVAGDVNQVRPQMQKAVRGRALQEVAMMADAAAPMEQESLFEYHLYTLNRPTTIANQQTKQVSLLTATRVPVDKQFLLQGSDYYYRSSYGNLGQKMKIGVFVEFRNDEESGLGLPMPKGVVRVYKNDSKGNAQFVGEDHIDHTPKNEDIRLKLGEAFDITADKKQSDFKKRASFAKYNHVFESEYIIELKNAKTEAVEVVVREPIPGDWKMLESTHDYEKVAAGTAEWKVKVPAEGSTILKYRALVRY